MQHNFFCNVFFGASESIQTVVEKSGNPECLDRCADGSRDGRDHSGESNIAIRKTGGRDHEAIETIRVIFGFEIESRLGTEFGIEREDFLVVLGCESGLFCRRVLETDACSSKVEEADRRLFAPSCRAYEHVGFEVRAVGEVDGVVGEAFNVSVVNSHSAGADHIEKVSVVIVNTETATDPEGRIPGLDFLELGIRVVSICRNDFSAETSPELVDEKATDGGAM